MWLSYVFTIVEQTETDYWTDTELLKLAVAPVAEVPALWKAAVL